MKGVTSDTVFKGDKRKGHDYTILTKDKIK